MKNKLLFNTASALFLVFMTLCVNALTPVSSRFRIINEPNRTSGWNLRYTSGFENTEQAELRYGFFSEPDEEYLEVVKEYIEKDDTVRLIEFAMFDPDTKKRMEWNEEFSFKFTFDASAMGAGKIINYIGKDYRLYLIDGESAVSVPMLSSDLDNFTVEINSLGVYALIYNRNALTFDFYYDEDHDIIYEQYENLNPQSIISLPEPPVKEGYEFAGWKYSYGSTAYDYIMEEGMTFGDAGGCAVAAWTQTLTDIGEKENDGNERYVRIHEWTGDYYETWQYKHIERADTIYPVEEADRDRLIEIIEKTSGENPRVVKTQYFFYDADAKTVTKILPDNFLVMSDKKSIRLREPVGIRFKASVLRSAKAETEDYIIEEYGYIAGRYEIYMEDEYDDPDELFILKHSGDGIISGVAYSRAEGIETIYDRTDEKDVFTCVLHGIPEEHYKTKLVCRPYAKITIDGKVYDIHGDIMWGSIYDTAKAYVEANPDSDDAEMLKEIIKKAEG